MPATPSPATSRRLLGGLRLGVGLLSLLAPSAAVRTFGVDPRHANPWVTRLFGSREVVLAGALLGARGPQARTVALLGAAVDGLDVVSSAAEQRRGRLTALSLVGGGGGAVLFAGLGLLAARDA